jgi:SAM-dependent methyltransferase
MSECSIDHSQDDVQKKLESQREHMPSQLAKDLALLLTREQSQETLNELFHLLKKYDLAAAEEREERNRMLARYTTRLSPNKINLARSYDEDAARRSQAEPAEWKVRERAEVLAVLRREGKRRLLEIGAGTGRDSKFFASEGFDVTCVDLSSEMVRHCREHGLDAKVMDFYELLFPDASFDAVYALNCLLHVPKRELGRVLLEIRRVLRPDGILYMGVYGGSDSEEVWEEDWCEPKRLFSFFSDAALRAFVEPYFDVMDFQTVPLKPEAPHFQSLILRVSG